MTGRTSSDRAAVRRDRTVPVVPKFSRYRALDARTQPLLRKTLGDLEARRAAVAA